MEDKRMSGFFEAIAREGGPLLAAWALEGAAAGAKALFKWDGARYAPAWRDPGFPELLPGGAGLVECDGMRVFVEPLQAVRQLVVCGAGHVAQRVIRLGVMLGFEVTAIEDRAAFAEKAREAGARRVLCKPFGAALDELPGDAMTAFVVMTREHAHDVECLRRILQKPRAYVGVMGSRSRSAQIRQLLLSEGFDAGAVAAVRMPVGVPIGARTPEEIAVSVAAELVSVMNAVDVGEGWPRGMPEELSRLEKPAVLAMIVEKRGEAPRAPGTKMLIRSDGSFLGTVGGGTAEAEILKAAGAMLRQGRRESRLMRLELKKGVAQCSGEIEVFLLPLKADCREAD